jgi:hypothetical protein
MSIAGHGSFRSAATVLCSASTLTSQLLLAGRTLLRPSLARKGWAQRYGTDVIFSYLAANLNKLSKNM